MSIIVLALLLLCATTVRAALYDRFEDLPHTTFDFIVVGGGSAVLVINV